MLNDMKSSTMHSFIPMQILYKNRQEVTFDQFSYNQSMPNASLSFYIYLFAIYWAFEPTKWGLRPINARPQSLPSQLISLMSSEESPSFCKNFFDDPSGQQRWAEDFSLDAPSSPIGFQSSYPCLPVPPLSIPDSSMGKMEEEHSTSESQQLAKEEPVVMQRSQGGAEEGCRCIKTHCQKRYCSCFLAGRLCTSKCRCKKCKRNGMKRHLFCTIEEFPFLFFDFRHGFTKKTKK